jgi:hypothetical protein
MNECSECNRSVINSAGPSRHIVPHNVVNYYVSLKLACFVWFLSYVLDLISTVRFNTIVVFFIQYCIYSTEFVKLLLKLSLSSYYHLSFRINATTGGIGNIINLRVVFLHCIYTYGLLMHSFVKKVDIIYHSTTPLLYSILRRNIHKSLWCYYCAKMPMPRRLPQYTALDPAFSRYTISMVRCLLSIHQRRCSMARTQLTVHTLAYMISIVSYPLSTHQRRCSMAWTHLTWITLSSLHGLDVEPSPLDPSPPPPPHQTSESFRPWKISYRRTLCDKRGQSFLCWSGSGSNIFYAATAPQIL